MSVVMSEHNTERAFSYAEDLLLTDIDSYAEWLSGQCFQKSVELGYVTRDPVELSDRIAKSSVAELVALTLYPRTTVAAAACFELRARYVQSQADWLAKTAADIRAELEQ